MVQKMTLREYTASFLLISFTLSTVLVFSGGIFQAYDTELVGENKDTVDKLNRKINSSTPDVGEGRTRTNSISTESDTFFLPSILTVVETVTGTMGSIPVISSLLVGELNWTTEIIILASIPVSAVIWEVVSIYRGIRT